MAKRGFFGSLLSAFIFAVVAFFILYFFIPSMSMQFLGVSFALRKGSVNAQVMDAVGLAVNQVKGSPEFTQESFERLQSLLSSDEVQQKLKDAAKQGQQVLENSVKHVTDMAR